MKLESTIAVLALAAASALAGSWAHAQKLYRWVDDEGVVHYGDRVPPEYANRERAVLNDHGVAIDVEQRALTDEERASLEQQQRAEAEARAARAETARRDRMLLETYLSVADIETLRDNRLEMLEAQVTVTQIYLTDLEERLARLEANAARYKPRNDSDDAPDLPQDLAAEIETTRASIDSYRQMIVRTRDEQSRLETQFDRDIERFKELKGTARRR